MCRELTANGGILSSLLSPSCTSVSFWGGVGVVVDLRFSLNQLSPFSQMAFALRQVILKPLPLLRAFLLKNFLIVHSFCPSEEQAPGPVTLISSLPREPPLFFPSCCLSITVPVSPVRCGLLEGVGCL